MNMKNAKHVNEIMLKKLKSCGKPKLKDSLIESLNYTIQNESHILKDEGKSSHHLILELNDFYFEMMDKIKSLQQPDEFDVSDEHVKEFTELLQQNEDQILENEIKKVYDLEKEIRETNEIYSEKQNERYMIQNVICDELHKKHKTGQFQFFLNLCDLEQKRITKRSVKNDKFIKDIKNINEVQNTVKNQNLKSETCSEMYHNDQKQDFITKNIKRVKNKNITTMSLTDEERSELDALLNDVDSFEDNSSNVLEISTENSYKNEPLEDSSETDEAQDSSFNSSYNDSNGYEFDETELSVLHDLEEKLSKLSDIDVATVITLAKARSSYDKSFAEVDEYDKDGKHWKNEKRLEYIEEALQLIQTEKNGENVDKNYGFKEEDFETVHFLDIMRQREKEAEEYNEVDNQLNNDVKTED